ncbi:MAG: hypothetical protein PWQ12_985 [Clostridiales bacterium]|jgi:DNA-binding transcriptional ArsR family regulator|nr:hypothetical protein [Clostridiales bacterium]
MKPITHRPDLDFIQSFSEVYPFDSDVPDPNLLLPETESVDYWGPHIDKISFPNRNLIKSLYASAAFVGFLMGAVYRNGIDWLIHLNTDSLIESFYHYTNNTPCPRDELLETLSTFLDDYYRGAPVDHSIFGACISNPESMSASLASAFSEAYAIFTKELLTPDLPRINRALAEMNAALSEDPEGYLRRIILTGYERFKPNLETLDVFMIAFSDHCFGASFDPDFVIISPKTAAVIDSGRPSESAMAFIKLLSDPKRYEMVKLLSKRPHYGAEIAKELDLTTATVSHHISKLVGFNLIEAEKAEKNRVYFKLNRDRFEDYLNLLRRDILV